MNSPVLEIRNLSISFRTQNGHLKALKDISLKIEQGETFGLAGESGSGKSTIAYAVMRYLPDNAIIEHGQILFRGQDLLTKRKADLKSIWGNDISMVYQDPKTSLNPALRIGEQIAESFQIHRTLSERQAWQEAVKMLAMVNLPDPESNARKYPHQLSGGMQQRVIIAMALSCDPELLIMDEPTTGLDVTTQALIIDLVEELKEKVKASILYITHDLSVIAQVSSTVGLIYAGQMLETGTSRQIFFNPSHPYTVGLLQAIPDIDINKPFKPIKGYLPDRTREIRKCIFEPRCTFSQELCRAGIPELNTVEERHFSKCFRWQEIDALRTQPPPAVRRQNGEAGKAHLVNVSHAKKYFGETRFWDRLFGRPESAVKAVDDVSFAVTFDEIFALVGESGCGKSTLARCLIHLMDLTAGQIAYLYAGDQGQAKPPEKELRRKNQIIFQHPDSSLNPFKSIRSILGRPLKLYGIPRTRHKEKITRLLKAVKLNPDYAARHPKELSGGEKQRVAIARALAGNPKFIILDEPVSALDVSIQADIIDLLLEFKEDLKISYLFISHDLSLVRHIADRVAVMYLGIICEIGAIEDIFAPPYHPYTKALLSAIPRPDPGRGLGRIRLEGAIPSPKNPPKGCRFHTRCPDYLGDICKNSEPPVQAVSSDHLIVCHIPVKTLQEEARIV